MEELSDKSLKLIFDEPDALKKNERLDSFTASDKEAVDSVIYRPLEQASTKNDGTLTEETMAETNRAAASTDLLGSKETKADTDDATSEDDSMSLVNPDESTPADSEPAADNAKPTEENDGGTLESQNVLEYTASLWTYKPVPVEEPEPFPEYLTKYENTGSSEIIAARVRGKKHKHEGTNCDDWFETTYIGDITVIAVADGAGSKKYSRIGAKSACSALCGCLRTTLMADVLTDQKLMTDISLELSDESCIAAYKKLAEILQSAVAKAYEAVECSFYERAANKAYSEPLGRDINIRDFSSTFLAAIIVPLKNEAREKLVISCQIGDGMIVLINTSGAFENAVKLMGEADSGEFSGETDFLTSRRLIAPDALALRTKLSRGCASTLMMMTDGVADDYFPNNPQMLRLYYDMVANGIITDKAYVSQSPLTAKQIEQIRRLPVPRSYPWVNDHSVSVPINYTNDIITAFGTDLKGIWEDRTVLSLAASQIEYKKEYENKSELLKCWLDNYVERGSFDDRTLVIAEI